MINKTRVFIAKSITFFAVIISGYAVSSAQQALDAGDAPCVVTDWHVNNLSEQFSVLLTLSLAPTPRKRERIASYLSQLDQSLDTPFFAPDEAVTLRPNAWTVYDILPSQYFESLPKIYHRNSIMLTVVGWDVGVRDGCVIEARNLLHTDNNTEAKFIRLAAHSNPSNGFVVEPVRVVPQSRIENKTLKRSP